MRPETIITQDDLRRISAVSIDEKNSEYCKPLKRDLARLRESLEPETEVVLLGSVATQKYIAPLCEVFGERIVYPKEFLGLGDMSRGGMMLRCCAGGVELEYQCVEQILTIQAQKKVKRQASAKQLKQMPVKETC